jgi:hypothetical protein
MADLFRGPVVVNRREPPIQQAVLWVAGSLLLTTLAAIPSAPVGAQSFPSVVQHPSHRLGTNLDTSQSSTTALIRALPEKPVGETAPFVTVESRKLRYLGPDSSGRSPLYARADPVIPLGRINAPHSAPDAHAVRMPLGDTTQDQPTTLKAAIPLPPFVPAPFVQAPRYPHTVVDTTQDTPSTLRVEALPVGVAWTYTPPDRVRSVADSTAGMALGLRGVIVVPPPFVPPPDMELVRYPHTVTDTSQDTPSTLRTEALPVGAISSMAPDRLRPVSDTSAGTPAPLRAIVAPPFVPAPDVPVLRRPWLAPDSSAGTPKPLLGDAQRPVGAAQVASAPAGTRALPETSVGPFLGLAVVLPAPFTPAPHYAPAFYPRQPADTTADTPLGLLAQVPFTAAPHMAPVWRPRLTADTSSGSSLGLRARSALPPFIPAPHIPPYRYPSLPADTTYGTPIVTQLAGVARTTDGQLHPHDWSRGQLRVSRPSSTPRRPDMIGTPSRPRGGNSGRR